MSLKLELTPDDATNFDLQILILQLRKQVVAQAFDPLTTLANSTPSSLRRRGREPVASTSRSKEIVPPPATSSLRAPISILSIRKPGR